MSPEQLLDNRDASDRRTDIYGLGATLYYGLTGQPPFKTENLHALMRMVLRRRPKPPHKVKRSVPRKLSRLVLRCLAKEQRDRPATAAELAAELRALFPGSPRKEARFGVG
jgi:serine/threonine-protein kinase